MSREHIRNIRDLKKCLRGVGCSERAIEKILKWYIDEETLWKGLSGRRTDAAADDAHQNGRRPDKPHKRTN